MSAPLVSTPLMHASPADGPAAKAVRGTPVGASSWFSTAAVLRSQNASGATSHSTGTTTAAAAATTRPGVLGLFPRRVGWGGALALFAAGFVDGVLATEWYLSRRAGKGQ